MNSAVPESSGAGERSAPWRDLILLFLAALALWGWTYGRWDMYDVDESRYVRIAAEWLQHDSWLRLTFNGEPYDQKPPLTFWIYASMIKLGGGEISPWLVRLPSVLAGFGIVVLTYLTAAARFGRPVGRWAGWIMLVSPLLFEEMPTARLDTFLTGFMTLSLWAWLGLRVDQQPGRMRAVWFWLGLIGAFFIKGPVGWVIALGTLALECWRRRSLLPWNALRGWIGLVGAGLLVGGWMWGQRSIQSGEFVQEQLYEQLVERVLSTELHAEPPYYYLEVMLIDVFTPWTFLLVAALVVLWRTRRAPLADWPALRPLVLWVVFPFVFLSIVPGKREQYLFPMLPAMAILVGWFVETRLRGRPVAPWARRALAAGFVLAGLGALGVAGFAVFMPEQAARAEFVPLIGEGVLMVVLGLGAAGLGAMALRTHDGARMVGLLIGLMALVSAAWLGCIHPAMIRPVETRELAQLLDRKLAEHKLDHVGVTGRSERAQYIVLGNYHMYELENEEEWLQANMHNIPRYILAAPRDWAKLEGRLGGREYRNIYAFGERGKNVILWEQVN